MRSQLMHGLRHWLGHWLRHRLKPQLRRQPRPGLRLGLRPRLRRRERLRLRRILQRLGHRWRRLFGRHARYQPRIVGVVTSHSGAERRTSVQVGRNWLAAKAGHCCGIGLSGCGR